MITKYDDIYDLEEEDVDIYDLWDNNKEHENDSRHSDYDADLNDEYKTY